RVAGKDDGAASGLEASAAGGGLCFSGGGEPKGTKSGKIINKSRTRLKTTIGLFIPYSTLLIFFFFSVPQSRLKYVKIVYPTENKLGCACHNLAQVTAGFE